MRCLDDYTTGVSLPLTSGALRTLLKNTRLLRLSAILESAPGKFSPNQLCASPVRGLHLRHRFSKGQLYGGSTARRLHRVPAYSTMEEAVALVDAALSYLTRMAFRSTLSGDAPDIVRGFFFPGATISQGTLQLSLK